MAEDEKYHETTPQGDEAMSEMDFDYPDINWCPLCGERRDLCQCSDDDIDAWLDSNGVEDEFGYEDERPRCGCPLCYCSNPTIAGETCNECLAGAHQG